MMENTETKKSLPNFLQQDKLEIVEQASVVFAAIGSVAAALTQQVIYAALPLTVAASLNLINRSRLAEKRPLLQLPPAKEITSNFDELFPFQPTPDLSESLPNLQDQIIELRRLVADLNDSTTVSMAEIRHYFSEQLQQISQAKPGEINTIYNSLNELRDLTVRLQTDVLTHADWERINVQFLLLQEKIARPKGTNLESSQVNENNSHEIQEFLTQIQANQQEQIEYLRTRIDELERKNQEIVKPYLQKLGTQVKQLQTNRQ